jgi:hypothetical protein
VINYAKYLKKHFIQNSNDFQLTKPRNLVSCENGRESGLRRRLHSQPLLLLNLEDGLGMMVISVAH